MSKSSCDSKNVKIKLKRKRRKRKSSKQNVKQVDNDVSRANNDFVHFSDLDTFSSARRPKNSGVIWKKKKGWSNASNVGLSAVSVLNLNKNVKRYSRKDLLACNNFHLGETSSAYVCNDTMNVFCNFKMNDLLDDNNYFIFDDVNVRISPVNKMPFRKKPCDSMHVRSKSFESSENAIFESKNQSENDCHVVENEYDQIENSKVIALGMLKLSVSQSVSPIPTSITSCDSKNVENLDTFSSVRRPKHSGVIWKKKGSSNTSNVDLYSVSLSKLNKNVKRYFRKDLLSCNNSYLGETSSAYVYNDAMNVSCNS
nr:hypothetical protein [Tanacetum cinerariifolium]